MNCLFELKTHTGQRDRHMDWQKLQCGLLGQLHNKGESNLTISGITLESERKVVGRC